MPVDLRAAPQEARSLVQRRGSESRLAMLISDVGDLLDQLARALEGHANG